MVTTIQLSEGVKKSLERMKKERESYEDVVDRLIKEVERKRLEEEALLIEGYKEMAEESLKICEDWKYADAEVTCEWDDGD